MSPPSYPLQTPTILSRHARFLTLMRRGEGNALRTLDSQHLRKHRLDDYMKDKNVSVPVSSLKATLPQQNTASPPTEQ